MTKTGVLDSEIKQEPDHCKIFQCRFCDKIFSEKGHLKDHHRTHTGNKPYTCKNCDASTATVGNIRKHVALCGKKVAVAMDWLYVTLYDKALQVPEMEDESTVYGNITVQTGVSPINEKIKISPRQLRNRDSLKSRKFKKFNRDYTSGNNMSDTDVDQSDDGITSAPEISDAYDDASTSEYDQNEVVSGDDYTPKSTRKRRRVESSSGADFTKIKQEPLDSENEDTNAAFKNKVRRKIDGKRGRPKRSTTSPNGKSYECELCGKTLKTSSSLRDHLRWHYQEKLYKCYLCGRAFTQQSGLISHIKQVHEGKSKKSASKSSAYVGKNYQSIKKAGRFNGPVWTQPQRYSTEIRFMAILQRGKHRHNTNQRGE